MTSGLPENLDCTTERQYDYAKRLSVAPMRVSRKGSSLSADDIPTQLKSRCQFSPDIEQNDSANHRQDETCRVKLRTWFGFGKNAGDQSPNDRATDPKQRGHYESEMLRTRHYSAGDQTNEEPDNDGPNDV